MKRAIKYILFAAASAFFAWAQAPTTEKKEATGLHFDVPVESPDGVWFQWSNASPTQTHSIYRRLSGTYGNWERVAMNLNGKHGGVLVPGFTLDQDWDYEFREDVPE